MEKTIAILLGIVLGMLLFVWLRSRRKKIREEKFHANKKVREDVLKQALANQLEPAADVEASIPHRPYKVNYATGENQENKEKLPLLQITEKSKISEKKYIFRANETIILGEQFGTAGILDRPENGNAWCEIFFQKDSYCIRSLGRYSVSVKRNKNTAIIDKCGIQLKSKDSIKIKESVFQVFYLKG